MRKALLLSALTLPFLFACPDKEAEVKESMDAKRKEMVDEIGHKAKGDIVKATNKTEAALNKGMDRLQKEVAESDKDSEGGW